MTQTRTFTEADTRDRCISVLAEQDTIFELEETFSVSLSVDSPSERVTVREGRSQTTVTILMDDDGNVGILNLVLAIISFLCIGVTVTMNYANSRINVPEGGQTMVCADLTGQLERDVVVRMETTTRAGSRAASEYNMMSYAYIYVVCA